MSNRGEVRPITMTKSIPIAKTLTVTIISTTRMARALAIAITIKIITIIITLTIITMMLTKAISTLTIPTATITTTMIFDCEQPMNGQELFRVIVPQRLRAPSHIINSLASAVEI